MPVRETGQGRRFEFRGGVSALDFVNTVAWRRTEQPVDYLESWEALMAWGRQAGLSASDRQEGPGALQRPTSTEMQDTLARAHALREAVHHLVVAAVDGAAPDCTDLSHLNHAVSEMFSRRRLVHMRDNRYEWGWEGGAEGDRLLWEVTRSAAALLVSPKIEMVKTCADPGCGWMFLDASRNHSRRWCDSRDCGNRERVRRHLARKRATRSAS